ncbi:caspase-9 [Notolabrus celidotus]|uniref:caspase-9 n=1 Tax=Notolabrus celidotus TaxID=1203425 RepID=UPI00148FD875|nr:caspase-9 [Notolabrus celidotus]XP_034552660.1 caspase-9 [Notolabrus celidotus]XP_034552661.1 caspase-9 [Notolabrus celidotus]XP_034552662.1 caspase-9 [Notolabrus celidotus]
MEERHRKILQRNRINLVRDLDPSDLYDCLYERGIFTQDMLDEIKSSGTRLDQARQLVRDLETRGSRAFPLFLECLRETGQHSLAELLQNGAPAVHIQPATPTRPVVQPLRPLQPLQPLQPLRPLQPLQPLPVTPPVDIGIQIKHDVTASPEQRPNTTPTPSPEGEYIRPRLPSRTRRDSIKSYKMDASPCGHCLIINNVEFDPQSELSNRKGSNIDCDKLERRFKALNFIVKVKNNLKQKQIKHELSALSKEDHSQYDCCVVIMLSHGTEVSHNRFPGAVYGVDGLHVPVQHITNYLNGRHCPSLQGKPKLFFIQACGGDERDTGFEMSPDEVTPSFGGADDQTDAIPMSSSSDSLSMSDEPDARATLPTPSDILVSYSTFPGYVSWRDTQSGSWYVEMLDHILEENAATDDLVTMLMMVNHEVSQNSAKGLYKQMPGSFNFLRKLLYFQAQS